jgi:biopolymer transport protein ExbB
MLIFIQNNDTYKAIHMIFLQATTLQVARSESVFDIIMKGGWILIPIVLMSIVAIYFVIERYTLIASVSKIDIGIVTNICNKIKIKDYQKAREIASSYNHPVGRVILAGLENPKRDVKDIEQIMAEEAKSESFQLEKNLGYIGAIASIAPMFGFLGTIFGVIKIFYNISLADNISIGIIAGGLYQKMVSSASGLTVGIIAYAGFYYLNTQIDGFVNKMERSLTPVLNAIRDSKL